MQIKLFFPIFNANQLFSPIVGEHKTAKERLKSISMRVQPQLKKYPRLPSKSLPTHIRITFLINRDNFDFPALLLLAHELLGILRLSTIIQDINNRCISHLTISHRFTQTADKEGCIIDFTD